jgi:DsbC/DsbD-like thiol-disulfide interchange protein
MFRICMCSWLCRDDSSGSLANQRTLGLYFKLEPGWHIYWKNAGDSGEPPRARWTLAGRNYGQRFQVSRAEAAALSVR